MINENKNKNVTDIIKTPKSIIPRSEKQKEYVRALGSDIIISAGPAGTGKTFSVAVGLTMLLEKIERIILSRPAVEAGED